ncbi:MAG TPA: four helix bundle protein [Candidatus Methylomirabilis sp.]|nr:four helix bundle protein [Candidatus Methylomirabilis sp.]
MEGGLGKLKIYKLAVRLEVFIHRVIDEKFPREEKYRSSNQLKRSSSSAADNIAESYGKYSFGAKINHLFIARGEMMETKSGIERAFLKRFISQELSEFAVRKYVELIKQTNCYINFLRHKKDS